MTMFPNIYLNIKLGRYALPSKETIVLVSELFPNDDLKNIIKHNLHSNSTKNLRIIREMQYVIAGENLVSINITCQMYFEFSINNLTVLL